MTSNDQKTRKPTAVTTESDKKISDGYLEIRRYQVSHEKYDGNQTPILCREVMDRGSVGAVIPFDPVRQEVILIEQFRIGAWAAGWPQPWLLECVAGIVEEGETVEEVVCREAREEAGCKILQLEPIAHYFSTPGACTEFVSLFCGRVDSTGLGGIHGLETEHEDICATVWPLADALSALQNGAICNSMTLIALQWLSGQHDRMTQEWLG